MTSINIPAFNPLLNADSFDFSILFERVTSAFSSTGFNDACSFLTSAAGQETFIQVTTADALEIVSSSASDTAAGTGTRTVGVVYLDSIGTWSETTVTMNGTTAVALTGIVASAVICAYAKTGGSSAVGAGNIDVRKVGVPTTIYERIAAGVNRSESGRFVVPTGYMAILEEVNAYASGQPIEVNVMTSQSPFNPAISNSNRYSSIRSYQTLNGASFVSNMCSQKLHAGQLLKIAGAPANTTGNPRLNGSLKLRLVRV